MTTLDRDWRATFWDFHERTPQVLAWLMEETYRLRERGVMRASVSYLLEKLRWESGLSTSGGKTYRINQNFARPYRDLMVERDPSLEFMYRAKATADPVPDEGGLLPGAEAW